MSNRRRTHLVLPLASLVLTLGLTPACGGSRDISFGPSASASASNLVPSCETLTPNGEFSTTINATVGAGILDDEELLVLNHQPLGDGQTVAVSADLTMEVDTGDEVCIKSSGTEENDDLLDDDLTEDEDCQTVEEGTDSLDFALTMSIGGCTLTIGVPATVSP
jgi:hypothetical protein